MSEMQRRVKSHHRGESFSFLSDEVHIPPNSIAMTTVIKDAGMKSGHPKMSKGDLS